MGISRSDGAAMVRPCAADCRKLASAPVQTAANRGTPCPSAPQVPASGYDAQSSNQEWRPLMNTLKLTLVALVLLTAAGCASTLPDKAGEDPEAGLAGQDYTPTPSPVLTK